MTLNEGPQTEQEVLRRGTAQITDRLPSGWTARLIEHTLDRSDTKRPDGIVAVSTPNSDERGILIVAAKRRVVGRDVGELKRRLTQYAAVSAPSSGAVVMAPYLSPPVRSRLLDAALSFVDLTGNMRVELGRPGLFIADRGADKDPWRGPGRPRGTLKGEPAARVVRALADFDRKWRMRELANVSGASTGATYRVIEYLEREGLVERDESGVARVTDWRRLLRTWSADYGLVKNSRITRWIATRGIPGLLDRVARSQSEVRYALTGTLAAMEWAEYAPATLVMAYVTDAQRAAEAWGLQPTESGANTILAEPPYAVMLDRTWTNEAGVQIAAPAQVVVDLLTGPGRSPSEAEALLSWMERNESVWRTHG